MRYARFLPFLAMASASCTFPEYGVVPGADGDATTVAVLDPEGAVAEAGSADGSTSDARKDGSSDAKTDALAADGSTASDASSETPSSDSGLPTQCVRTTRYIGCTMSVTWAEARAYCLANGGDLVRINTSFEQLQITSALASQPDGTSVYIGLNDQANEGIHVWADGSSSSYFNWATGQPNNGGILSGTRDCVAMTKDGKWTIALCSGGPDGFICEDAPATTADAGL